ncbi:MAG: CPBP family intramembrane glutamic endopeptidase [Planctomycetota bacterium]
MNNPPEWNEPPSDSPGERDPNQVFTTAILVEMGLGVAAVVIASLLGPDCRAYIPEFSQVELARVFGGLVMGLVFTVPMILGMALVKRLKLPAIEELRRLGDHPMMTTLLQLSMVELIVISLCAGVGEELLFRGWLMPAIAGDITWLQSTEPALASDLSSPGDWFGGHGWLGWIWGHPESSVWEWWSRDGSVNWLLAWAASSVLFGFAHPISKAYFVITALLGVYLGFLLLLTGNLLVPIAAHATYDAVELWLAKQELGSEPVQDP